MKIKALMDMVLALFRKNNAKQEGISHSETEITWDVVVYCDNPRCKQPIADKFVAYDAIQRTAYHPCCECELYAASHPTIYRGIMFTAASYIPMKTAIEFYNKRKLAQATALDMLVEGIEMMGKKQLG